MINLASSGIQKAADFLEREGTSLLSQIDGLVDRFNRSAIQQERGIEEAHKFIEQLSFVFKSSNKEIAQVRKCLSHLLFFKNEEVLNAAINELSKHLIVETLVFDIELGLSQELVDLKTSLSLSIESYLENGGDKKLLLLFLHLYEDVLEHLWLLSHVNEDQSAAAIINQNQSNILRHADQSMALTLSLGDQDESLASTLGAIQRSHVRISDPLPPQVKEAFNQLNSSLQPFFLLDSVGNIYLSISDYRRAIIHFAKALAIAEEIGDRKGEGQANCNLGDAYDSLKEHQKAIEYLDKALAIAEEIGDRKGEGRANCILGDAYNSLKEHQKAIKYLDKALVIAEEIGDRKGEGRANCNLGDAYDSLKEHQKAIKYLDKALVIAEEIGDRKGEGRANCILGIAYGSIYEYLEGIKYFERMLAIAQEMGDLKGEGIANRNLGASYSFLGMSRKAIEYYGEWLKISMKIRDRAMEGEASRDLGIAYVSCGEYQKAIENHERGLTIAKEIRDRREESKAYCNLGVTYKFLGKYQKAIEYQKKYLVIAKEIKDRYREGAAYCNLANNCYSLGQYLKAIEYADEALIIFQEVEDRRGQGDANCVLGNAYNFLREYRKAITYHEKALEIAKEIRSRSQEGSAYGNLGTTYQYIGEYQKAIENHERALTIAKQLRNQKEEGSFNLNLGNLHRQLGNEAESLEYLQRALVIFKKIGAQDSIARACTILGGTYLTLGRFHLQNSQQSEGYLRQAIEIYSGIQRDLDDDQEKITIFENQSTAYFLLERALLFQGKYDEALEATDFRRSRSLVDILGSKLSATSTQPLGNSPLSLAEAIQLALTQNTTFVIYSLALKKLSVWVVVPDGRVTYKTLQIEAFQEDLTNEDTILKQYPFRGGRGECAKLPSLAFPEDFNDLLREQGGILAEEEEFLSRDKREEILAKALAKTSTQFKQRLQDWYEIFIKPLEDLLPKDPNQKVTIIPDGFLAQMPFAIFKDDGKYLIEKHTISFAPSIQTLILLEQYKRTIEFPQGAVVVGNPEKNLPQAEIESNKVADLFGEQGRLLTGDRAQVQSAIEGMKHSRYIHFACHGDQSLKPNIHSVFEGALRLAPSEGRDPEEGYLYAQDIAHLDLKAELVFMSACHSGRGKMQEEGIIGNVRSFLAAGALSVVGTYWTLPDSELTVDMVQKFYEHVLGKKEEGKVDKAKALREAMLMAIQKDRESPHKWGAFFLTGLT